MSLTAEAASQNSLLLDDSIRIWVLLPITAAMFLVGVLRHLATKLLSSKPIQQNDTAKAQMREAQAVIRSQRFRRHYTFLPAKSFAARRKYFIDKENGIFQQDTQGAAPQQAAMGDPNMMMDMMKRNMSMVVPQILIAAWVNFFYSGFITAKVPFPLTQRFRAMLQRGVELQSLDVTYVSSLSWYFLNLFGLRGLFSIVLGENTIDDAQMAMQMQQQMATGIDTSKAYVAERENIELIQYVWALEKAEESTAALLQLKLATYEE